MKTICVISGGMDSTTLLYKLLADGKEVKAISFNYGQRHARELKCAALTCLQLHIPHKIIDISYIKELVSNSALTSDIAVPEGHYEAENMKLTVVPNRNMIMASMAIGYAINEGFDEVALGVHAGDHHIYFDCRSVFIKALATVAELCDEHPINIYTPFLNIDKGDIAIEGKKLGVDYSLSWTCYKGENAPCGKCGACVERKQAFEKAEMNDPLIK